jgi:hypothetical protein
MLRSGAGENTAALGLAASGSTSRPLFHGVAPGH